MLRSLTESAGLIFEAKMLLFVKEQKIFAKRKKSEKWYHFPQVIL